MRLLVCALALATPATSLAQTSADVAAAVDPARLAAARALIEQIFPPATRDQMIQSMMEPMIANVRQAITGNASLAEAIGRDPRVKQIFERFMDRQMQRSIGVLKAGLPGMSEAMARAYARRFSVAQLQELAAFFATPTGQAYVDASKTIMADPDVGVWQRDLMTRSMADTQNDIAAMAKEISALPKQESQK